MKRLGIDIGGTFTDVVVYDETTRILSREKVLSTPSAPEQAVMAAVRATGCEQADLSYIIHGTTLVTNLILEKKGARIGLITTQGFRDILEIMRASRERPYDLAWRKPRPIVSRDLRREVRERVNHRGEVLIPLQVSQAEEVIRLLLEAGVAAIAICFLHAYSNPIHERQIAAIINRLAPAMHVTISSDITREIREFERTSTTVLNAYAMPRVHGYLENIARQLPLPSGIRYMSSAGGVIPADEARRRPVALALSGPAGGVLAGQFISRTLGLGNVVTMDMGGTSLDVCVIQDGRPHVANTLTVEWGFPIRLPAIQIKTIGAGGGSIIWVDEAKALQIGPESAGASPGPACYRNGGTRPTVTDANLLLGILNPEYFLGGRFPVDPTAARTAMEPIADAYGIDVLQAAEGAYRVVNAKMAQAIRQLTVEKGIDPRDFSLLSFGGAGGQHAVQVAREASIGQVILPIAPSVLSALGMITADVRTTLSRTVMQPLSAVSMGQLLAWFDEMEAAGGRTVHLEAAQVEALWTLDLRYQRQSHELSVPVDRGDSVEAIGHRFEEEHQRLYGSHFGHELDLITIRCALVARTEPIAMQRLPAAVQPGPISHRSVFPYGDPLPVFRREALGAGSALPAPCIVEEPDSVHLLPGDCEAVVDEYGNIMVKLL